MPTDEDPRRLIDHRNRHIVKGVGRFFSENIAGCFRRRSGSKDRVKSSANMVVVYLWQKGTTSKKAYGHVSLGIRPLDANNVTTGNFDIQFEEYASFWPNEAEENHYFLVNSYRADADKLKRRMRPDEVRAPPPKPAHACFIFYSLDTEKMISEFRSLKEEGMRGNMLASSILAPKGSYNCLAFVNELMDIGGSKNLLDIRHIFCCNSVICCNRERASYFYDEIPDAEVYMANLLARESVVFNLIEPTDEPEQVEPVDSETQGWLTNFFKQCYAKCLPAKNCLPTKNCCSENASILRDRLSDTNRYASEHKIQVALFCCAACCLYTCTCGDNLSFRCLAEQYDKCLGKIKNMHCCDKEITAEGATEKTHLVSEQPGAQFKP